MRYRLSFGNSSSGRGPALYYQLSLALGINTEGWFTVLTGSPVKLNVIFPHKQLPFTILTPVAWKVGYVRVVREMKSISDRMRISSVAGPDQHACIAPHVVQMLLGFYWGELHAH
jgi:hypothetical protein